MGILMPMPMSKAGVYTCLTTKQDDSFRNCIAKWPTYPFPSHASVPMCLHTACQLAGCSSGCLHHLR